MIDVDSLITAYKQGFFPMADEITRKIYFYSPEKRAVFPIDKIKPKKSVVKFLKQQPMKTTINYDFRYVITECSNRETT
jgi:leucyl/phenylalanyl-tRNA--protein transferase